MTRRRMVLTLVVALLISSCGTGKPESQAGNTTGAPDILMFVLDACRADHMGCYGYRRETTPAIDTLANDPDAVMFRHHYVQGTWTKASTASLFTGLFPFQHGVLTGETMTEDPDHPGEYLRSVLADRFETMAERLRAAGYYTVGAVKSRHLVEKLGFAQGFDEYYSPEAVHSDEDRLQKILDLVRESPQPIFAYLHLSGCHHPFPKKRRNKEFMSRYRSEVEYDEKARMKQGVDFTTSEMKHAILERGFELDPSDVAFLNLLYDSELRTVDDEVKTLIDGLQGLGRYDGAVVIVSADHGEELYDHGGYAHGRTTWDEVARVPLIVKFPKGRKPEGLAHEVEALTQSIDLLPSFLALAGQPPPDDLPGTDIFGGKPRGFAFSQTKNGWAIARDGEKLVADYDKPPALFDLKADPHETHDLSAERPEQLAALERAGMALQEELGKGAMPAPLVESELDDDTLAELKDLGYLR